MREKVQSDEAEVKCKERRSTVESVFGIIEHVLGFTRFLLHGLGNVKIEGAFVTLAYNCKRLAGLRAA